MYYGSTPTSWSTNLRYSPSAVHGRPVSTAVPTPRIVERRDAWYAEDVAVFVLVVVTHLAFAWVVMFDWGLVKTDAVARVANAYYVFWSRDPHLGAIGFIWTPLMSVLELPLVLWKPLASTGIAGAIVSTVAGGINAVLLLRIFRCLEVRRATSVFLLLTYSLHPMTFYYVSNGMTESIFIGSTLLATYCLLLLKPTSKPQLYLGTVIGLAGASAFLVRYEGAVLAGVLTLAMMIRFVEFRRGDSGLVAAESEGVFKERMIATAIHSAIIPVGTGLLWMFFNWMIMGSPFYFLTGDYSNTAQISIDTSQVTGHGRTTLEIIFTRLEALSVPYLVLTPLLLVWSIVRRSTLPLVLVLVWSTAMAFQVAFALGGMATKEGRYFMTIIPAAVIFGAYLIGREHGRLRFVVWPIVFALMIANPILGYVGLESGVHLDDWGFARSLAVMGKPDDNSGNFVHYSDRLIADLNAIDGLVLMDTFMNNPYYLKMDDPKKAVITSDQDYKAVLENPRRYVQYILVVEPRQLGVLDQINARWPNLYAGGEAWTQLVGEYQTDLGPKRRLYKVLGAEF